MKSAYFVHSHMSLSLIKALSSSGLDLITTVPNLELFSSSHTEVLIWNDIIKGNPTALYALNQYDQIIVSSESDWIELLFIHPKVHHILEITKEYDKEVLLQKLYQKSLEVIKIKTVYKHGDHYLQHAKICYLMGKYPESESHTKKLLMVPNRGEEALLLLLVNAVVQNQLDKALQLINCLAYNKQIKNLLDFILLEKQEEQKKKMLFRAGRDFASAELVR